MPIDFSMHITGVSEALAAMDKVVAKAEAASVAIVAEGAALVENVVKRNFEGSHPRGAPHVGGSKPNVVSGTLRRSVRHAPIVKDGITGAMTTVGPTIVYGRRIELGFTGTDSAGRTYHQPPYPYFAPGVESTREELQAIARRHWGHLI